MHSRAVRVMLVALLLGVAIGAGIELTRLLDRSQQLAAEQRALLTRLAQFDARLAELAGAQAAYVAPGQPDAPWFARVSALTSELRTELAAIQSTARSQSSAAPVQAVANALMAVEAADASARDSLTQEQELIAADVVFGESREAINAARSSAATIARFESAATDTEQTALRQRSLLVAAGAGGIVLLGILLLAPRARSKADSPPTLGEIMRVPPTEPAADFREPLPTVDLAAAAELCTALSRVVSSAALPDMLARAAALVDAPGVIVWMGSGDELFAVMSHGYDPRSIRRLGSIPRGADNATAESWRTGELRTVAGDTQYNGAIVAPMFGPESCVGVLAAEVRRGREQDPATQAVTTMIAAQLAMVVGAWPATSPARAAEG
jgi:hypothetical protein